MPARSIPEAPNHPHLEGWTAATTSHTGTRRYASPSSFTLHTAQLRFPSAPVAFDPEVDLGRVEVTHSFLRSRHPCILSDMIHRIMSDNPALPLLQVVLSPGDQLDLAETLTAATPASTSHTQTYYIGNANADTPDATPSLLFSAQPPPRDAPFSSSYLRHKHTHRYFSTPDPHTTLPIYSLSPTLSQTQWESELHGVTTPTTYMAARSIPIPLQHPTPFVAPHDPICSWDGNFTVNTDLAALPTSDHVCLRSPLPDHIQALRDEVASLPEDWWGEIFDKIAPLATTTSRDDGGSRHMVAATIPNPHPSDTNTHPCPALVAAGNALLGQFRQGASLPGLEIQAMAYIRASAGVQAWHRDFLRACTPAGGQAFSAFLAVNVACPSGPMASKFVPRSGDGLPDPFIIKDMDMAVGDCWAVRSTAIHAGGGATDPNQPRVVAFVAMSTWRQDYGAPVPVTIPPSVLPGSTARRAKCRTSGCRRKPQGHCLGCEGPLCNHCQGAEGGLCSTCRAAPEPPTPTPTDTTQDAIPAPARTTADPSSSSSAPSSAPSSEDPAPPTIPIPTALECLFPLHTTSLHTVHLYRPTPPTLTATAPAVWENPPPPSACPLARLVHEHEDLPPADPTQQVVVHTPPGEILVIRSGLFGGVAIDGARDGPDGGKGAHLVRWLQAPPQPSTPVDPSVLVAEGGVVTDPADIAAISCPCHQV